jgi:sulfate transport system permease protein
MAPKKVQDPAASQGFWNFFGGAPRVLPGFRLILGFSLFYVGVLVLAPLAALVARALSGSWEGFWAAVLQPRALASYRVSFGLSFWASLWNGFAGLAVAWVLSRYDFPGKRWVDGLVDLPLALPTAVAGIALTALYSSSGWMGAVLARFGISVDYTPLGIWIALVFVGTPFVVRTLQPLIVDFPRELEEAAACLGARPWQTFLWVILPKLVPAWTTGILLAFGRAVGEYGSVIFIAGNLPYRTEITPLLIVTKLEEYDVVGAAALGTVLLASSLAILLSVRVLEWTTKKLHLAPA